MQTTKNKLLVFASAVSPIALPLVLQGFGNAWVRIADVSLLYIMLAVGPNIVVGYAGSSTWDMWPFRRGAYLFGLLASPHLTGDLPGHCGHVPERAAPAVSGVGPISAALLRLRRGAPGGTYAQAARRPFGHRHPGIR